MTTNNLHTQVRSIDFSLLEEDTIYLLGVLCAAAAGKDVEVDKQHIAHIHSALLTQYTRGW